MSFDTNLPMLRVQKFSGPCFAIITKFGVLRLEVITAFTHILLKPVGLVWFWGVIYQNFFRNCRMMLWEKSTLTALILFSHVKSYLIDSYSHICSVLDCFLCKTWHTCCVSCNHVTLSNAPGYLCINVPCWNTSLFLSNDVDNIFFTVTANVNSQLRINICIRHSSEMSSSSLLASAQVVIFYLCFSKHAPGCCIVICAMSYKPCIEPT